MGNTRKENKHVSWWYRGGRRGSTLDCVPLIGQLLGKKIVTIGTSFTDYGFGASDETFSSQGYTALSYDGWTRFRNKQRIDWVNKGVAGDNIQGMIDRFEADVVAENPTVVIFEAGINDASSDRDVIIEKLKKLYKLADDNKIDRIVLTIPYRELGVWNTTVHSKIKEVNGWIMKQPNAIDVNEFWAPSSNSDRPLASHLDNTSHPSNIGGFELSKPVTTFINSKTASFDEFLAGTSVIPNESLSGTGGSVSSPATGTMPDDYRIYRSSGTTGGCTATALQDGCSLEFTSGGQTDEEWAFRTTDLNNTVEIGKTYELLADVDWTAWDGWKYIRLRYYEPTNFSAYDLKQDLDGEDYPYPNEVISGLFKSIPLTQITTTARIYIEIGIKSDATGTGTLNIHKIKLREVS